MTLGLDLKFWMSNLIIFTPVHSYPVDKGNEKNWYSRRCEKKNSEQTTGCEKHKQGKNIAGKEKT